MQLKAADDRTSDIAALEALASRPDIDVRAKQRIRDDLVRLRAGIRGEREAAYEIEFHLGSNPNRITIHDLRVEVDGRVAQIDHLILDRLLGIWVCESKHFAEGVAVNDEGEWTAFYGRRAYGIGSPIAQNRKHIAVLDDVFANSSVELPRRFGITLKPQLRSLILVSNSARITRPKSAAARARIVGLDSVIKVDQLMPYLEAEVDKRGIRDARRIVSAETIDRIGRDLVALHRPAADWSARYGISPAMTISAELDRASTPSNGTAASQCAVCGRSLSAAVVAYCGEHHVRFGGRLLCFDCQRAGAGSAVRAT